MNWTQYGSENSIHTPPKDEILHGYSKPSCVPANAKRRSSSLMCYSASDFFNAPKFAKRRPLCAKHTRCATQTIQPRNTVRGLFPNSNGKTAPPISQINNMLPNEHNTEEATPEGANFEHTNSQEGAEGKRFAQMSPGLGKRDTLARVLAVTLTQGMQCEGEEIEAIEFLQRENDELGTQLIHCNCRPDNDDLESDDLYSYWLRQQTRLDRMKALHERIRGHRVEVRRILELLKTRKLGV